MNRLRSEKGQIWRQCRQQGVLRRFLRVEERDISSLQGRWDKEAAET